MRVDIVTPAPPGARNGNRVTALRWARALRRLGHAVRVRNQPSDTCDLLVALHAVKSGPMLVSFRRAHPHVPVVVALTGTDVYPELAAAAVDPLRAADRIVVLQPLALDNLPDSLRGKARIIYQSASPPPEEEKWLVRSEGFFDACVVAHLRSVKDPLRAGEAALQLPPRSKVRVSLIGRPLEAELEERAVRLAARTTRFAWLGELPRRRTLVRIAASRLLVSSSHAEGGANVIGEAIVAGVPVLATRIPGSIGLLGADYAGLFDPGDTLALAVLLRRCEVYPDFLQKLAKRCALLRPLFDPGEEQRRWGALLAELR